MRKRFATFLTIIMLVITLLPAGVFADAELPSVDDKAVCYTPASDYRGGDCVLTSCKTMLRRYAISKGSFLWTTMTNKAIRPYAAPSGGLKYTFEYKNDGITYTVKHGYFESSKEKGKIKEIEELLKTHKEGIIVWGGAADKSGGPHGVLAVKVKNGVVYAIDSAYNRGSQSKGIQKWSETTMSNIKKCSKYWAISSAKGKSKSGSKGNAKSTICIAGVKAPSSIKKGNSFSIYGEIDSNYLIKSVEVAVIDSKGDKAITASAKPSAWRYDVHELDERVKFGKLGKGKYTYRITAKDEKKTAVLHECTFKVTDSSGSASETKPTQAASAAAVVPTTTAASTLKIKGATAPTSVVLGKGFGVAGKITSNKKITKVTVSITDSEGNAVISETAKPNKKSYDLSALDKDIKFGTLSLGTYTYKVTATDKEKTADLVKSDFKVVKASTLRIKSYTYPEKINKGKAFDIKGQVKSNRKITKVWIAVFDSSGKRIRSASAKPNKKKYELAVIDSKIRFNNLKKGEYTYKVTAKDTEQKLVLIKKNFTVY